MDLSFLPLTLEALEQPESDTLCLFVAEDERPLSGLAGLADWRLNGALSRLLRKGVLTGAAGENLLMPPPGGKLRYKRIFVFGIGPQAQPGEQLAARVTDGLRRLPGAGVLDAALHLPAQLSPERGVRALLETEGQGPARACVFGADPAKLVLALSHAASRGEGPAHVVERRVVKVAGPQAPSLLEQVPSLRQGTRPTGAAGVPPAEAVVDDAPSVPGPEGAPRAGQPPPAPAANPGPAPRPSGPARYVPPPPRPPRKK